MMEYEEKQKKDAFITKLIVTEYAGIDRIHEPITKGIPMPCGRLSAQQKLYLESVSGEVILLQSEILAFWPDGTAKWVLLDFQICVEACRTIEINLYAFKNHASTNTDPDIKAIEADKNIIITTEENTFEIDGALFKPFKRIISGNRNVIDHDNSNLTLIDAFGINCNAEVEKILIETTGPVRTTVCAIGVFNSSNQRSIRYKAKLHFFNKGSLIKIDFSIHNPHPAEHPGGLWDLGDSGSISFSGLSLAVALNTKKNSPLGIELSLYEDSVPMDYQNYPRKGKQKFQRYHFQNPDYSDNDHDSAQDSYGSLSSCGDFIIHQNSSGGDNWQCENHVDHNNLIETSFKGYQIFRNGDSIKEGVRANPQISATDGKIHFNTAIQYFWQNFPKSLRVKNNKVCVDIFPVQNKKLYELQGGEMKTHTLYLAFKAAEQNVTDLGWINTPLDCRATPQWYGDSGAIPYLKPDDKLKDNKILKYLDSAVDGDQTFFSRREQIDEYGWRNFGDCSADHEAIGAEDNDPFVSHYNNQYDVLCSALVRYMSSGNFRWFLLADQLAKHIRDIDIYHTNKDRPEYNHGMFWHTDHYIRAKTATHRCFSVRHANRRNMAFYGGGPSLSHNYSTGLLYHYFITGEQKSSETVKELSTFVENNIATENTVVNRILNFVKNVKSHIKQIGREKELVQTNKVYGLNGPGRASGNTLNTLLDAYSLTGDSYYLNKSDELIRRCLHPLDNINNRDLLDAENRWMYTVFLQALGKYLDIRERDDTGKLMRDYAGESLVRYGLWMLEHERLYLDDPDKLEFPNETWAAQEIRKCNVLLYASKHAQRSQKNRMKRKAEYFYRNSLSQLETFGTRFLTRPIAILLQNHTMYPYFSLMKETKEFEKDRSFNAMNRSIVSKSANKLLHNCMLFVNAFKSFSVRREIEFIKWRLNR